MPLVPSPSLIRASVVSVLPCCPAASTVTSLAGCGPPRAWVRLIGVLTVYRAEFLPALTFVNRIRSDNDAVGWVRKKRFIASLGCSGG